MKWPDDYINKIICGDCLEVMKGIPDGAVDLVVTDPPYGIDWNTNYSRFSKGAADKSKVANDDTPFDPKPFLRFGEVILWGANNYADKLPPASWLIWDKRNDDGTSFLSDGEIAWWSHGHGCYIKSLSGQKYRSVNGGLHPTQKPLPLMRWCIEKLHSDNIILDPFVGLALPLWLLNSLVVSILA